MKDKIITFEYQGKRYTDFEQPVIYKDITESPEYKDLIQALDDCLRAIKTCTLTAEEALIKLKSLS